MVSALSMSPILSATRPVLSREMNGQKVKSLGLVAILLFSTLASLEFVSFAALASTDQDGDGLTYGLEYLINTQPNDWDSDNDQLPDGWEWKYGLDPLSSTNDDGAVGDPDGDGFSNLQEYNYLQPSNWDSSSTPTELDKGVWWNGTVPVNNWDEENAMQYNQPACGDSGSDGTGNVILCDEDPVGNICTDGFDNDKDGMVDSNDNDFDGDADCATNDDDGDGLYDEDPNGWDTDGDGMPDGWEASNNLDATSASNADGANGDPDGDGLINIYEYVNPSWKTTCGGVPCFKPGPDPGFTETESPCNPVTGVGAGGCLTLTAETDLITDTDPNDPDTDNDGLNDSYEALTLLTDPTDSDTDDDGIDDGTEVNGAYGNPAQASNPLDNNTDDDAFDDGDEDTNGNGVVDGNETDPTRREDSGDFDNDGLENWEENLSCTSWNIADTDFGGVNDGDESNASHGTDPCDSLIDYSTTILSYNGGTNQLTVTDGTGFNPGGGIGFYNSSGTLTQFSYATVINDVLQGVSVNPGTATDAVNRNGSFCHDSQASYPTYCDDDYTDLDGDGLANWEETLAVYGWGSNPTLADSDGDGVNDYDEVTGGTDPQEPCNNNLDTDGDGLNNYFETSTGCANSWIGISNGSSDIWSTDEDEFDTDAGGVNDKQEYFDSTNPVNDPSDDIQPDDFDGDGIPDAVENFTGTDWRNPDTDGGGVVDGVECTQQFWFTGCVGGPFDPWDPSDDVIQNDVIFWANNTSGVVDNDRVHQWRLYTFDHYTGVAYGLQTDSHPAQAITVPYANDTNLAPSTYSNSTVSWTIDFNNPVMSGAFPVPAYQHNITFWSDSSLTASRTNDTHTYTVTAGLLEELWIQEHEYWFDWATIAPNTIAGTNSSYETTLPPQFSNLSLPESLVLNVTNEVISNAGATDAYSKAAAISDFLINGNATFDFKRNYNGSGSASEVDISFEMLNRAKEGTCSEFTTLFVTMARTAGLPARYVTGYSGGSWNGNGYTVLGSDLTQWGEVRLEMNPGSGGDDLGWIPFDTCPAPEELQIVNMTWSPATYDRDGSSEITVTGTLQYLENTTAIPNITMRGYVVPVAQSGNVPGEAAVIGNQFATITTDANGNFSMNGTLENPALPGYASIVIEHMQMGYVSHDGIDLGVFINMTDDSNITHDTPLPADNPVLGAGATTVLTGQLNFENNLTSGAEQLGDLEVWLEFTSSEDGLTNLSAVVGPSGVWEINVTLSELETKSNLSATLGFSGWQDTSQAVGGPQFHLRPSTHSIIMDIRDAPDLSATIEGPGTNNSRFLLGDSVYINGTAQSFGASPTPLPGNLSFGIRDAGGGGAFVELFNSSVNGSFSLTHLLAVNGTPVSAGILELSLTFYPDDLNTTDSLNTSGTQWWLEGLLFFELSAGSQLRGQTVGIVVEVTDHLGNNLDLNLSGDFEFDFDGSTVNTTTDPASSTLSPTFSTNANLVANDYPFDMKFNGNDYFQSSSNLSYLRIMAEVDVTVSVVDDWTHLGNQTWLTGSITDSTLGTSVLGNDSIITAQLMTENGPFDLANGMLNNSTGTYNFTITAPTVLPSGVYDITLMLDFDSPSVGGPFYQWVDSSVPPAPPNPPSTTWGIESEVYLTGGPSNPGGLEDVIAEINTTIDLPVWVGDIADNSNVTGSQVEYIVDYGGSNTSIGTAISDSEGNATLSWLVSGVSPGNYILRMQVQDDVTDPKGVGATRHIGNSTEINITIQVESNIRIDSIPTNITAGVNFQVVGQIEDGDNSSRPLTSAVAIEMFWFDNPNEKLINGVYTSTNGSFNFSVPTDVLSNGTKRGLRNFVISVVEDSNPFYLTDTSNHSIQVMGVTVFENLQPLNPIVVNRGNVVNISLQMVESSDMFQPLEGYDIALLFDDTWLAPNVTSVSGQTTFSYTVPFDQPLGLITMVMHFNGSSDLLPHQRNLSTVTIRSTTLLVVDAITANPVAGESFNITGTIESDNGSGLQVRDGTPLSANILFLINDETSGFQLSNGTVQSDGTWRAVISLDSSFEAGTHVAEAQYIPSVNYYTSSRANESFDSRGFTILSFLAPTLDGASQPSLNDRTDRGDNVTARVQLIDNSGAPVVGSTVTITLNGTLVSSSAITDAQGIAETNLSIPIDADPGFHNLNAEFLGIAGTTGLLGDNASVKFAVLAETVLSITESTTLLTVGDILYVNGTLLDDLGNVLQEEGSNSQGVVHLIVDGDSVVSVLSDSSTGEFSISWSTPTDITAGLHLIEVEFTGGRDWVDPIGVGDNANPDFYYGSTDTANFSVSVPTQILLLTQGGDVEREGTLTVQGTLLDIVDNPLDAMTIEIWLDGEFLTNVTTDGLGQFTAVYPVPSDATLGPVTVEARFNGTPLYLPSSASGIWNIYSQIFVIVNIDSPLSVGQSTTIDGFVGDNQLTAIPEMNVYLSVEGITIGNVTTDIAGNFTFDWLIPDIFSDGENVLTANVPEKGWYLSGEGNTTFFLAHRSEISASVADDDATRLDYWELSGLLYDVDTVGNDGLPGETIEILLDGVSVTTTVTGINGEWSASIIASESLSRGSHDVNISFAGSEGHLPVSTNLTVVVWADTIIQIDSISQYTVRSDETEYPIVITGRVTEIGGQGVMIDGAELKLANGPECDGFDTEIEIRCISISSVIWNNGVFTMTAVAPSWLEPGLIQLNVETYENSSLFLRSSNVWTNSFRLALDIDLEYEIEEIIIGEQEVLIVEIDITAKDTGNGVSGIPVTIYLESADGIRIENASLTRSTDDDGNARFEFNADPPYGNVSEYGELVMKISLADPFGVISDASLLEYDSLQSTGIAPSYTYAEEKTEAPWWTYVLVALIVAAGVGAVMLRRKRAAEAAKEISEIFSYTAELLAAGDSMREAIFQCYESLIHVLLGRGFLRRDFETVREFEMAIRKALPGISEEALVGLDSIFEEARYSRHEMGEQHKRSAQEGLSRVVGEIESGMEIPNR